MGCHESAGTAELMHRRPMVLSHPIPESSFPLIGVPNSANCTRAASKSKEGLSILAVFAATIVEVVAFSHSGL